MSRRGNPSSGLIRRAQLRPKVRRLTPLEHQALLALDKHLDVDVEDLGRLVGVGQATAYRLALSLVERGQAVIRDGRLVSTWGGTHPDGVPETHW